MDKHNSNDVGTVCSDNSLLVVGKNGIYRLYCPFKATVIKEVASYVIGQTVVVIAVKMANCSLIYVIKSKQYSYSNFMLDSEHKPIQPTSILP